nr:Rap1a/Tai family immunity protein [Sinorhizobium meliloti]
MRRWVLRLTIAYQGATYGDVRDAVCKWVSNYPEERHRAGALLVPVALREAWPCNG